MQPNEPVSFQLMFNFVCFVAGAGVTWWVKTIWQSVVKLQAEDAVLTERVHQVELLVAGDYAKKDDINVLIGRVFQKLDKIEAKIEQNALRAETAIAAVKAHDDRTRGITEREG